MPSTYLDAIANFHRARAYNDTRDWRDRAIEPSHRGSLRSAISLHRQMGIGVIAEIKRRSPSLGDLGLSMNPAELAALYSLGGAVGISVLTDVEHFGGSREDLESAREAADLPILRKDFTVCENDVFDARDMGASCVLLIVAILSEVELASLLALTHVLGMDALVEVHTKDEASKAISSGANMIGVNQRDLHTFKVDTQRAEAVVESIPSEVVAVAESGFHEALAVERAAAVGFDAVLVGESLVKHSNPAQGVREFSNFPIGRRFG